MLYDFYKKERFARVRLRREKAAAALAKSQDKVQSKDWKDPVGKTKKKSTYKSVEVKFKSSSRGKSSDR